MIILLPFLLLFIILLLPITTTLSKPSIDLLRFPKNFELFEDISLFSPITKLLMPGVLFESPSIIFELPSSLVWFELPNIVFEAPLAIFELPIIVFEDLYALLLSPNTLLLELLFKSCVLLLPLLLPIT